jgi:anti-sigma factor RsiW
MTNRIQNPEWEALSAYLDNQLPPKDRSRLEDRLKREAELRQALEEMRRTRAVLRSQRPLRAPRNFTLTPAMAGVRRRSGRSMGSPFGVLRLASVLATIFFVLLTVGDLAVQRFGPPPREVAMSEQVQGPAVGMGGGGGGPGEVAPMMEATVEAMEEPAAAMSASAEAPDTLVVTPGGTPVEEVAILESGERPAVEPPVIEPPAADQPLTKQGEPAEETTQSTATRPQAAVLMIRVLQGLLVTLAVGAGLAAFYLRRTSG